MITIKNKQKNIKISTATIKKTIQKMLTMLQYETFDLGVEFVTDTAMQKYNKQFRNKDKPTDILSFPFHPHLKAGEKITVTCDDDKNLGDIIIAPVYTRKNAQDEWGQTLEKRLNILLAHGIAHLLGYDHETDTEFKQMQKLEKLLLKAV